MIIPPIRSNSIPLGTPVVSKVPKVSKVPMVPMVPIVTRSSPIKTPLIDFSKLEMSPGKKPKTPEMEKKWINKWDRLSCNGEPSPEMILNFLLNEVKKEKGDLKIKYLSYIKYMEGEVSWGDRRYPLHTLIEQNRLKEIPIEFLDLEILKIFKPSRKPGGSQSEDGVGLLLEKNLFKEASQMKKDKTGKPILSLDNILNEAIWKNYGKERYALEQISAKECFQSLEKLEKHMKDAFLSVEKELVAALIKRGQQYGEVKKMKKNEGIELENLEY